VKISYDPAKIQRNIRERGLSFERAAEFDRNTASIGEDARKDYPERRFLAVGDLDARLNVLCFCETVDGIRVISFRKANDREVKSHAKATTD
jgi:uncharacterized DUF497 family protein